MTGEGRVSQRLELVRSLGRHGIREQRVLSAMAEIPRELFVPADLEDQAYVDRALPIGQGQTVSQPWVVARMTELLDPRPEHHVLEIGTGSGYQASILGKLAGSVISVERHAPLATQAEERLRALGIANVQVVHGDASAGYAAGAPYDRILVTAASPGIHPDLAAQLAPAGRIVAPVGTERVQELVVHHQDGREEHHGGVQFVPLIGRAGFRPDGGSEHP